MRRKLTFEKKLLGMNLFRGDIIHVFTQPLHYELDVTHGLFLHEVKQVLNSEFSFS